MVCGGRRVAYGYRAAEVLPRVAPTKRGKVQLREGPAVRRKRSRNFINLPDVPEIPGVAPLSADRYDQDTTVQGAYKRYARDVPPLNPERKERFRQYVRGYLRETFTPLREIMDYHEWLESESYPKSRREQITREWLQWSGRAGPLPGPVGSESYELYKRLLSRVKAFGKLEPYPEYKHVRHINARCDLAKGAFGPLVKSMEREVYSKDHHFIKHVSMPDRPALIRALKQAGCQYVATDHTAFEAHFTVELMEIVEFELVVYLLGQVPAVARLLCEVEGGMNDIQMRGNGYRMLIDGIRCSGDMWTSLFNGFGNLMSFGFACQELGSKFDGYVEGDDGIFAVSGEVPSPELMKDLGFEVKMEVHSNPEEASFCGLILAGDQIIRDPIKFLQKFGWTSSYLDAGPKMMRKLALAKSLSALYETPDCPIVSAAARFVYDRTKGVKPVWESGRYRTVPRDFRPPKTEVSTQTRVLFAKLYKVSPEAQVAIEEKIAAGDWECCVGLGFHRDVFHYTSRYVELT